MAEPSTLGLSGYDVGEALDSAADLSSRYLTDRAGLSASAEELLERVSRRGPNRLTELAREGGTSQPAMTQRIQRLEIQGWVRRLADPNDGRVNLVAITEAGRALLDERMRTRRQRLAASLAMLTPEEKSAAAQRARRAADIASTREIAESLAQEDNCGRRGLPAQA